MVDSHIILARINKIRECVAKLRRFGNVEEAVFLTDSSMTDSAERNLRPSAKAGWAKYVAGLTRALGVL